MTKPIAACAALLVWSTVLASQGFAACPQDLCACFPNASNFDLVALKNLTMQPSALSVSDGFVNWLRTSAGRSCADRASVRGNTFFEAEAALGELVARKSNGVAVRFALSPSTPAGEGDALAACVDGVATGGGKVLGSKLLYFNAGAIDATGASPSVAECRSAADEVQAAGKILAQLAPTRSVGALVL